MLVISRRVRESLLIGADISVTVLAIHGEQVKLGISAPKNVVLLRAEISAKYDISTNESESPSDVQRQGDEAVARRIIRGT